MKISIDDIVPILKMNDRSLRNIVRLSLAELPEEASWGKIKSVVCKSAVKTLPPGLVRRAEKVFHDDESAYDWLLSTNVALGGKSPLEIISEEPSGEQEVLYELGRIEHGVCL